MAQPSKTTIETPIIGADNIPLDRFALGLVIALIILQGIKQVSDRAAWWYVALLIGGTLAWRRVGVVTFINQLRSRL